MQKIYLHILYCEKDEAKLLGAKWDMDSKRWYTLDDESKLLDKYQIYYLEIPYEDKEEAKKLGKLYFDGITKRWFTTTLNKKLIDKYY